MVNGTVDYRDSIFALTNICGFNDCKHEAINVLLRVEEMEMVRRVHAFKP